LRSLRDALLGALCFPCEADDVIVVALAPPWWVRASHLLFGASTAGVVTGHATREVPMSRESLEARIDRLERRVELLEQLPQRITALEVQIVQLREEMRSEFSAIRVEIQRDLRAGDEETRGLMRVLHEDVIARIATLKEGRQT
jgi:hypothetical protein